MEKKEEVKEEIKEVEPVEVAPTTETKVEEPVEEGITRNLKIGLETYNEFFARGGLWQQLKTSVILSVVMVLVLYLMSDRSSEDFLPQFLKMSAIYVGVILGVSLLWGLVFSKMMVKSQYKKSKIEELTIITTINNVGIFQKVENQEVKTTWAEVKEVEITNNSLFFILYTRSAVILTIKDVMSSSDIDYIKAMVERKLGPGKLKLKIKEEK